MNESLGKYRVYLDNKDILLKEKQDLESLLILVNAKITSLEENFKHIQSKEVIGHFKLSSSQNNIVYADDDYILVIACAGSGKTHTLIARYIRLIMEKIYSPEDIILITFTRKAGTEMSHRLENKLEPTKMPNFVGSLHSFAFRTLKYEKQLVQNAIILEDDNKLNMIDEIISSGNYDYNITDMLRIYLSKIIDIASCSYPIDKKGAINKYGLDKYSKHINECIKEYDKQKKLQNLFDYNDLMVKFCEWLNTPKSDDLKKRIKYIFFDEFQDINPIQYWILLELSKTSKLMVIGDDDQAIYSFRGSDSKYILDWEKNFPKSKTYYLEQNYRSNSNIINFNKSILKNNISRKIKDFFSEIKTENKPRVYGFHSQIEQYKFIASDIKVNIELGVSPHNIAVLARNNHLLKHIELELANCNIKCCKSLGSNILDKEYVKDFLALLSIIINTNSIIHWKRILLTYLNSEDVNYIVKNSDILASMVIFNDSIKAGALTELINNFNKLFTLSKSFNYNSLFKYCQSMIEVNHKYYNGIKEKTISGDLTSLIRFLSNDSNSLEDKLSNLYINRDFETNTENLVWLSTIHSAKGLEWDNVYIIDITSKDLPDIKEQNWKDELKNVEEERRLFYTGTSRAKNNIVLCYWSNIKNSKGNFVDSSPFLKEINSELYILNEGVSINKIIPYESNLEKDVKNYLNIIGYRDITPIINSLIQIDIPTVTTNLYEHFNIDLNNTAIDYIYNYIKLLTGKMLVNNYNTKVNINYDKPIANGLEEEFSSKKTEWIDSLNIIGTINDFNFRDDLNLKETFSNGTLIKYYKAFETLLKKLITKGSSVEFRTLLKVSKTSGFIDIYSNDSLILLTNKSISMKTILYGILTAFLAFYNKYNINKIIWINITNFKISGFEINHDICYKIKNIIYFKP